MSRNQERKIWEAIKTSDTSKRGNKERIQYKRLLAQTAINHVHERLYGAKEVKQT